MASEKEIKMMWKAEWNDEEFNIRDGVCGIITGRCSKGLFLELENGQAAFAYFGGLAPGTEVFCTVLKKATEILRVLVLIDSVMAEASAAV